MPEYSSTTITPSDGVQVPGMNGSTSGNFLLSALKSYILSEKGLANGLASLDGNGKLLSSQLPDLADDVIVVASYASLPATGTAGKIYITADNNKMYRWDPDLETPNYVELSIDLSEYARIVDIQDGNIQAGVAVKAFQDAMGRAIITTYETKADASDLKDAIQANSNRISNLEQEHGGYVTVNYRGTYDVPTGKAKYALVESIVGKSRAWNQLSRTALTDIKALNTSGTWNNNSYTLNGVTFTFDETNGKVTVSGTASSRTDFALAPPSSFVSGHTILIMGGVSGGSTSTYALGNGTAGAWDTTGNGIKFTVETPAPIVIRIENGYSISGTLVFTPHIHDLTLIFPEGVPSTIAECVQKCPDILTYDAYGTSIVDTTVEGVKAVGFNLWDGTGADGEAIGSNGSTYVSDSAFATDYIPMRRGQSIYLNPTNWVSWVGVYDANKTFIQLVVRDSSTSVVNIPVSASYARFTGILAQKATACINISGSLNGTYKPWINPSTLTLPSSVTLRSAGSVADTDELNVEVNGVARRRQTTRIKAVNLAVDFAWTLAGGTYEASISDAVYFSDIVSPRYHRNSVDNLSNLDEFGVIIRATKIYIKDSQGSPTGYMNYQLATESATLLDPIENNTILTEGGGTIETIQNNVYPDESHAPTIDNSMDIGYLAL